MCYVLVSVEYIEFVEIFMFFDMFVSFEENDDIDLFFLDFIMLGNEGLNGFVEVYVFYFDVFVVVIIV